jgi:hypothetical protein
VVHQSGPHMPVHVSRNAYPHPGQLALQPFGWHSLTQGLVGDQVQPFRGYSRRQSQSWSTMIGLPTGRRLRDVSDVGGRPEREPGRAIASSALVVFTGESPISLKIFRAKDGSKVLSTRAPILPIDSST